MTRHLRIISRYLRHKLTTTVANPTFYQNLQSTNWQTVRFKPPPPNSDIGWRVEFRSMEVQLTDFENAAFSVFIVLLTRVILSFGLNFYIPITKVDENMQTAHQRGAAVNCKFYFRKNVFTGKISCQRFHSTHARSHQYYIDANGAPLSDDNDEYELMTMDEIINGKVCQCSNTELCRGIGIFG